MNVNYDIELNTHRYFVIHTVGAATLLLVSDAAQR